MPIHLASTGHARLCSGHRSEPFRQPPSFGRAASTHLIYKYCAGGISRNRRLRPTTVSVDGKERHERRRHYASEATAPDRRPRRDPDGFLARLRWSAEILDIVERQHFVRLLVREALVNKDNITIHHSIPISGSQAVVISTLPESRTLSCSDSVVADVSAQADTSTR